MTIRMTRVLVVLGLFVLAAARPVRAGDDDGRSLYLKYCSACHGESGKGDGVVSQSMRPKPTDLTQLAKGMGGTFPVADIAGRIDGTETSRVHGDPDMPVWGQVLREGNGKEATGPIRAITDYLKSIQAK